ncbi:sensor histidine kinase [Streptomyces crystallinus]|uniref:Signal transduction histidine kinase subgroup 3 dimerisation and phosphoacceptor domain-containing protein n=1 Tax=Streptomyces crystallinus TaxID=68191 RepID=A0ABP3S304_9ACTN
MDLYTRNTMKTMLWFFLVTWGALPLLAAGPRSAPSTALAVALLVVNVAQCAVGTRRIDPAYDEYLGHGSFPRRLLVAPAVLLAVGTALLAAVTATDPSGVFPLLLTDLPIALMIPYALLVPVRAFLLHCLGYAALVAALFAAAGVRGMELVAPLPTLMITGALMLVTVRPGAWGLRNMWQAEEARDVQARLAVAEERLRFGRDMHDVLGRNLAVIALKSELAVQLAERGRPEAVAQMIEVQRIARESQREVREVVRGYREADLGVELDGARGVLEAAGIDCTVAGAAAGLPAVVQSALGWVVREATTNVLRHGNARGCAIRLTAEGPAVTLVVENDGVPALAPTAPGSGLAGLRERLAPMGGTLEAARTGERFVLTATVPLRLAEEVPA